VRAAGQAAGQSLPRPPGRAGRAGATRAPASPPNALSAAEQDEIIKVLTSERFCDKSVALTWATLLDEGVYLASMSTMHRLLRLIGQAGDRRKPGRPSGPRPSRADGHQARRRVVVGHHQTPRT
jgi:hypothetical protein